MCLIAFDFRPSDAVPLRLIANRDEFHARPTAALGIWADAPAILGGRDLVAGGGWLAMHEKGRFAAVTNVRDPRLEMASDAPSRGGLVRAALECDDLPTWLASLAEGDALRYAGFNLLAGDGQNLWHLHRGLDALTLADVPPGLHGVSNATLDTPWPKLVGARQGLAASLHDRWPQDALAAFADTRQARDDQLPDTGVGLELERRLSAPFIIGQDYGTRATSWLEWHADGRFEIGERRFGPLGVMLGEQRLSRGP
ncbi:NRDE family protein [Halomonas caseinilytica]|uniref:NRDE family protein n=1 Tax=Halomonas caseinilytica TaxID=438744 RepID=UPI00084838CF|nr:NRDE family protein [Halomonas caseinilytica]